MKIVDTVREAETLILVDVANLAYRSMHAYSNLATAQGEPTGHIYGSVYLLLMALENLQGGSTSIIFCYEGKGAKQIRQAFVPAYKAQRTYSGINPLPATEEVLSCVPGLHMKVEGKEADDLIAWGCEQWRQKKIIVLSSDKDMWALTRFKHVEVFSPNIKRMVTPADIEDEFGVKDPHKIYLWKAIFGDASDNVKGVERLQKKIGVPVINDVNVHDVETFYAAVKATSATFTPKTMEKLNRFESAVHSNFRVVQPFLDGIVPKKDMWCPKTEDNKAKLQTLLRRYECYTLVQKVSALYE